MSEFINDIIFKFQLGWYQLQEWWYYASIWDILKVVGVIVIVWTVMDFLESNTKRNNNE